jgi:hypothetical protein
VQGNVKERFSARTESPPEQEAYSGKEPPSHNPCYYPYPFPLGQEMVENPSINPSSWLLPFMTLNRRLVLIVENHSQNDWSMSFIPFPNEEELNYRIFWGALFCFLVQSKVLMILFQLFFQLLNELTSMLK